MGFKFTPRHLSNSTYFSRLKTTIREPIQRLLWTALGPLLHVFASSGMITLTCSRWDGGGAQIQARYSVEAFSKHFGFPFQQQSLSTVLPDTSSSILEKWNDLLGLSGSNVSFTPENCVKPAGMARGLLEAGKAYLGKTPLLIDFDDCHAFTNLFPSRLESLVPEFRQRAEKALANWEKSFGTPLEEIIVHLRRGLIDDGSERLRLTSDSTLLEQLKLLREKYPDYRIRIYTYESSPELEKLVADYAVLDSKSSEFQVVLACSRAKVFLMAKSSLSYVAAMLNPNTVFYQEFWHPKLSSWIKIAAG